MTLYQWNYILSHQSRPKRKIQSSQQVGLRGIAEFVRIQFGWWAERERALAVNPIGGRLSASKFGDRSHRAKLDTENFGDEAGGETNSVIESCTLVRVSLYTFYDDHIMIAQYI